MVFFCVCVYVCVYVWARMLSILEQGSDTIHAFKADVSLVGFCVYMCMYVYVHVCVCVYIYIYIYIYRQSHMHTHTHTNTHTYKHTHIRDIRDEAFNKRITRIQRVADQSPVLRSLCDKYQMLAGESRHLEDGIRARCLTADHSIDNFGGRNRDVGTDFGGRNRDSGIRGNPQDTTVDLLSRCYVTTKIVKEASLVIIIHTYIHVHTYTHTYIHT
jgi:hypothetical protein